MSDYLSVMYSICTFTDISKDQLIIKSQSTVMTFSEQDKASVRQLYGYLNSHYGGLINASKAYVFVVTANLAVRVTSE